MRSILESDQLIMMGEGKEKLDATPFMHAKKTQAPSSST